MDTESSFATALRATRHAAGLTLEELAEASGVSVRALSDMERGRALGPQRRTVVSIADALPLAEAEREAFFALAKAGRTRSAYLAAAPGITELPGSIGDFTGRSAELAWITGLVEHGSGAAVVSGGAGLGKTTLVVHAAHRLRDRFPDGVHFVDALGMSRRPVAGEELLARVLRAFGVRDQQIPKDAAERAARYRHLLREKRVLVIVDDVAAEAQVRPMLPGAGHSRLLVTSRRLLAGLEGVRRLHLDPMPAHDASDFLRRILTERGDVPGDDGVQGLVDLLDGLPLALRIIGNRLVSRPQWSAAELAAKLSVRLLDQLSAGDLKVSAAFGMSYDQLSDVARRLFRRVALAPGADFGAALAAVVGGITVTEAEDHLDDLVDLGLVQTARGGRYRLHDLVRLYAQQCLDEDDDPGAVTECRDRMVSWLLATLMAAGHWFQPGGGDATAFESTEDADAWIRLEAEHWLPALGAAALAGEHDAVMTAVSELHWFGSLWPHWPHWTELYTLAHDSAVASGALDRQAEFLSSIAWTYAQPGREVHLARDYAERALALAQEAGAVLQQGRAWQNLARARLMTDDPRGAMDAVSASAEAFERAGDVDAFCQTLLGRGDIALRLGEPAEALDGFQRALSMVEDPGSGMTPSIAAATLPFALGQTARALGQAGRGAEGVPMAERAVELLGGMQTLDALAMVLRILADLYDDDDRAAEAEASLERAAEIYTSTGRLELAAQCRELAAAKGRR